MTTHRIPWTDGVWTNAPADSHADGDDLIVRAESGSDAWLQTYYGFRNASEHALTAPLPVGSAMEIDLRADFSEQFDQAGLFVRLDAEHWVKAGVEFADGQLQLGAVVTSEVSDWSVAPVPEWRTATLTIRVSRHPDALIIRVGTDPDDLRLVRVAPFSGSADVTAGPYLCAPTRAGFAVNFLRWELTAADKDLH